MRNFYKSRWLSGMLFLLTVAILNVGCSRGESTKETETELAEGQRRAAIEVVSITGNEITYYELEEETEAETEETSEAVSEAETGIISETATSQTSGRMGRGQRGGMQGMSQMGDGTMPAFSQMSDGEMPDMSQMGDGEMPDMSQMDDGEMPDMSQRAEKFMSNMNRAETVTTYLPVGVAVYTDIGKKTTFSILEAGDELEVLFETNANGDEIITEIWITGAE